MDFLKSARQEDLGIGLKEEQWIRAQDGVHSTSICARHGLIQFRVLHCLHLSKVNLSKMFPSINPLCDQSGAFTHFLELSKIIHYLELYIQNSV